LLFLNKILINYLIFLQFRSKNAYWVARLGILRRANYLESPFEQVRRISRIIVHPNYVDKGFINDIVLLKLETPIKFR
jgi:corin